MGASRLSTRSIVLRDLLVSLLGSGGSEKVWDRDKYGWYDHHVKPRMPQLNMKYMGSLLSGFLLASDQINYSRGLRALGTRETHYLFSVESRLCKVYFHLF